MLGSQPNKNFTEMKSGAYKMAYTENLILHLTLCFPPKLIICICAKGTNS
jgi:hypothetical protein